MTERIPWSNGLYAALFPMVQCDIGVWFKLLGLFWCQEIAEQSEKQDEFEAAVEFYSKAADLYQTEDSNSEANKCLLKVAQYEAKLGRHNKAVEVCLFFMLQVSSLNYFTDLSPTHALA